MLSRTFQNELDNNITIETKVYRDECDMIEIKIKGPRSDSEWQITVGEAIEVQRQIGLALLSSNAWYSLIHTYT